MKQKKPSPSDFPLGYKRKFDKKLWFVTLILPKKGKMRKVWRLWSKQRENELRDILKIAKRLT